MSNSAMDSRQYESLTDLQSSLKDRQVADRVKYINRRSTKRFGDDGM